MFKSYDLDIGVARKKYFRSQIMNLAPCLVSDITLLSKTFVSINDAIGAPASPSQSNIIPPVTNFILWGSDISGQ